MTANTQPWLGIDFGTCRSSAAVLIGKEPRSVGLGYGYSHQAVDMPTAVFIEHDGTIRVGEEAVNMRGADPTRYFDRFKLSIGNEQGVSAFVHGARRQYSWRELVAAILARIRSAAEAQFGAGQRLTRVVLTVPALYADSGPQWTVMEGGARDAGFQTIRILREPHAAAVYFDSTMRRQGDPDRRQDVTLVYDLGGGTFDPALLRRGENGHELLGAIGNAEGIRCGGIFFDEKIREHFRVKCAATAASLLRIIPRRSDGTLDPTDAPIALRQAHDAIHLESFLIGVKHRFADETIAELRQLEPVSFRQEYHLTRAELDAMIAPSLEATLSCCDSLVRRSGIKWGDVHRIIMVGGSCNLPLVREKLQSHVKAVGADRIEICWRRVGATDAVLDPLLAVSLGAAIAGAAFDEKPVQQGPPAPTASPLISGAIGAIFGTAPPPARPVISGAIGKILMTVGTALPAPPRRDDLLTRRMIQIITEQLGVDAAEVTPDASFVEDLGADSLDTVELIMAFEEEFGVEISDEDAERIRKVRDAIEYVDKRVGY